MGPTPKVCYRRDRRVYYTRIHGKQHSLGTDYDAAITAFQKLTRALGINPNSGQPPRTIASLVERWQTVHASQFQLDMTVPFAEHVGPMAIEHIPIDILQTYAQTLIDRGLTAESINKYVRYARAVLRWGHNHGYVLRVPPRPTMPAPMRNPKDASREQIAQAFARLRASKRSRLAYYIFTFIAETGCRPGEARRLAWGDVRLADRICVLPRHKTAGRGKPRVIIMNTRARAVLRLLLWRRARVINAGQIQPADPVFCSSRGEPYTRAGLYIILKRLGIYPYQLRHTWAQNSTLPDAMIAAAMGHSDLRTILTYRHVKPSALVAAVSTSSALTRTRAPAQAHSPTVPSIHASS